ncbi:putative candidate secreted effector protein [Blumeria hordei DH14]|uniref:Putative candidate secreted effector protein n=1 Tax=Blumeria graminis f. sp. hordei (strain DH14) TaxID=546991 RepID=N1JI03_BLUG1|nr:putative candidate secreted effector protein [Blumeria hordei DH14]
MRLLGSLTAVPFIFSVYVVGKHGYICSDAEKITNTFYDQALVEKSVTSACVPDSELSAAKLAANVEAKKYPQVWVDSKDYGFKETVLLWKYQGNSPESLEESNVFVFTNKSCDILGLLQKSGDQYTICKDMKIQNDRKTCSEILSKKPRPGIFSRRKAYYDMYPGRGDTPETAITLSTTYFGDYDSEGRQIGPWTETGECQRKGFGRQPPMQAPPMQGPPMQGRPMQGPPMQGSPMQRPPMQGPPMGFPSGVQPRAGFIGDSGTEDSDKRDVENIQCNSGIIRGH